ncbi:MAG TPA: hypothetical protein VN681_13270 [Stellaceae bacterium]|nr:hypothetical protein [Stellaceae bacterium]
MDHGQRLAWRKQIDRSWEGGRITSVACKVARALERMLGGDGQLDPAYETIATVANVGRASVKRALDQLRDLGVLAWTRRLTTDRHGHTRQTSNAYRLLLPAAPLPSPSLPARLARQGKSYLESFSIIARQYVTPLAALAGLLPPPPPGQAARMAAKFAEERRRSRETRMARQLR